MTFDEAIEALTKDRQAEDALRVVVAHLVQAQVNRVMGGDEGAADGLRWALDLASRMLPDDKVVRTAGARLAGVDLKRE